jgi:hypothetical protein
MEFKHTTPLSTKEHWGEPKQKKVERRDLMARRSHHGWLAAHLLKITSNFVSNFDMSPRCPSKRESKRTCFFFLFQILLFFKFFYYFWKMQMLEKSNMLWKRIK